MKEFYHQRIYTTRNVNETISERRKTVTDRIMDLYKEIKTLKIVPMWVNI